jgi:hypothetical protein
MKIEEASPDAGDIPTWALEKAQRRYRMGTAIQNLAEMFAKHEQPPVDDDVLIVRAVIAGFLIAYRGASMDDCGDFTTALFAYRAKKAELEAKS